MGTEISFGDGDCRAMELEARELLCRVYKDEAGEAPDDIGVVAGR